MALELMRGARLLVLAMLIAGCDATSTIGPSTAEISIRFEVREGQPAPSGQFAAALTLVNRGSEALSDEGWSLYFNSGSAVIDGSLTEKVVVSHVNGDLYRMEPTPGFEPLVPGESRSIDFFAAGSMVNASSAPAGFYFVFDDGTGAKARTLAVSDYVVAPSPSREKTAAARFETNRELVKLPPQAVGPIVPTAVSLTPGGGQLTLDGSLEIHHAAGLDGEAAHLAGALEPYLGVTPVVGSTGGGEARATIELEIGPLSVAATERSAGDEAYRLTIDSGSGIEILGSDAAGVFYGIQSLLALLPLVGEPGEAFAVDEAVIEDAPRFGYRGLHLDVSRNFHTRESIERLLDLMALYKLNRFHFHLTDDEGWRPAIEGLPELVEVGSRRGHTVAERDHLMPSFGSGPDPEASYGSGHYSRTDLLEILRYATERHIEVIPEIDVPGHARAAIKAMELRWARLMDEGRVEEADEFLLSERDDRSEYRSVQGWNDNVMNVCQESTYRFLERVVDDLVSVFAEAGSPLTAIHIGGDEVPHGVWEQSPACERLIRDSAEIDGTADLYAYFVSRFNDLLADRGLVTAGWEEIALVESDGSAGPLKLPNEALLDRQIRPHVWNNIWGGGAEDLGYRLANAGFDVVLSNASNLYFDLAYEPDWWEPGYAWAGFVDTRKAYEVAPLDIYRSAREDLAGNPIERGAFSDRLALTEEGRQRILGIQGQLWSENAKGEAMLEYLALPKMLALAERAWAASPEWAEGEDSAESDARLEIAWNEFANRLGQRELPRLDRLRGGFQYRLPPPGAVIEDGVLMANVALPGLEIRYTTDGSDPGPESPLYAEPVAVDGTAKLRTFDARGRGSRTAVARVDR